MNKGIAHILMVKLTELPFIQRFGGLAMVATEHDSIINEGHERRVINKYPVVSDYIDGSIDCPTNGLLPMTPNSNLTGLMFFEDLGARQTGKRRGKSKEWNSRLRLIVWLNTEKLMNSTDNTKLDTYSTPSILHARITELFDELYNKNLSPYAQVRIKEETVIPQDEKIFSKYTFDLKSSQYILPPYEYYAVDYSVLYYFNPACVDDMIASLEEFECNPQAAPSPVHYPTLSQILQQMATKTIDLVVGTDTETGQVVHILREHGLGDETKALALSDVYILGLVLMNSPVQGWKIAADDAEALDFTNTDTGGIFQGTLTITFRKKTIDV